MFALLMDVHIGHGQTERDGLITLDAFFVWQ
jgi:hypothetical protein